jgi:hypothetical protein
VGKIKVGQHPGLDQFDRLAGIARLNGLVLPHDGDHVVGDALDEGVRRGGVDGQGVELDANAEGQRGKQGSNLVHLWFSLLSWDTAKLIRRPDLSPGAADRHRPD